MALTRYKLVGDTNAVFFKGDTIPVEKIDDTLADKLFGKTHVLERISPEPTPAVAVVQLALASEATGEAETPATGRKRVSN